MTQKEVGAYSNQLALRPRLQVAAAPTPSAPIGARAVLPAANFLSGTEQYTPIPCVKATVQSHSHQSALPISGYLAECMLYGVGLGKNIVRIHTPIACTVMTAHHLPTNASQETVSGWMGAIQVFVAKEGTQAKKGPKYVFRFWTEVEGQTPVQRERGVSIGAWRQLISIGGDPVPEHMRIRIQTWIDDRVVEDQRGTTGGRPMKRESENDAPQAHKAHGPIAKAIAKPVAPAPTVDLSKQMAVELAATVTPDVANTVTSAITTELQSQNLAMQTLVKDAVAKGVNKAISAQAEKKYQQQEKLVETQRAEILSLKRLREDTEIELEEGRAARKELAEACIRLEGVEQQLRDAMDRSAQLSSQVSRLIESVGRMSDTPRKSQSSPEI